MRNIFLTLVILFVSGSSLLAQSRLDSLEAVLKTDLADTAKISTLTSLSREYQFIDFSKSLRYTTEALALAEKTDLPYYKTKAYQNASSMYISSGDFSTALRYDNLSLQLSLASKDSTHMARNYNNVGHDYFDLGEYDDAYFYFTQSYRVASATNDSLRMLVALHNVGRVFKELGQFDQALNHLYLSKKMSEVIGDTEGIPFAFHEIGDVMLRKNKPDSALLYLSQALSTITTMDIDAIHPQVLTKIGDVYLTTNDFEKALAYYDSAYELHVKTKNKYGMAEVELGRGIVLTKEKKYDDALRKIETSLTLSRELNARVLEIKGYNHLSQLWEMKGDHKKSLFFYKQFKLLEDSLFSQEMQGKLLRDQIRFETESLGSQIAALNRAQSDKDSELRKQEFVRNILVVVMALSGILLVTVYRSGQRRRKINTLLLEHQDDMEKRSEELERLNQVKDKFFSIISHDLRSPINALAGLLDIIDKGAIRPDEMHKHTKELKARFNHTRTLLNNLLDWTLLQMDKLNLQAAKINLYKITEENISLLSAVQDKHIEMINKVPSNAIGFADSNTINLVIRNLMTNAIKFTNDGGKVVIDGVAKGNEWVMSVHDNGVGIKAEVLNILFDKTAPYTTRGTANEKGTGLGLILCKEFVEKNGGRIWVESEEDKGSTFFFTLPKAD